MAKEAASFDSVEARLDKVPPLFTQGNYTKCGIPTAIRTPPKAIYLLSMAVVTLPKAVARVSRRMVFSTETRCRDRQEKTALRYSLAFQLSD